MADTEFEQFEQATLCTNKINSTPFYSLVHGIAVGDDCEEEEVDCSIMKYGIAIDVNDDEDSPGNTSSNQSIDFDKDTDCDNISLGAEMASVAIIANVLCETQPPHFDSNINATIKKKSTGLLSSLWNCTGGERKRRKLPEIPRKQTRSQVHQNGTRPSLSTSNRTITTSSLHHNHHFPRREQSLADELDACSSSMSQRKHPINHQPLWRPEEDSVEYAASTVSSESMHSNRLPVETEMDSGHCTSHSPSAATTVSSSDGFKSLSPSSSNGCLLGSTIVYNDVEMLEATHRALHKFIPRHEDEIDVEIGDPLYVHKESDDLWSEGVNLRTGRMGIFPSAYAVDCDYSEWDATFEQGRRERFLLGYMGSVETLTHKGTTVVCQAVKRVTGNATSEPVGPEAQPCVLEISDQGLRMVDRRKRNQNEPCIDYFYSLKNVSFCAYHPHDHRYLGFITKHPHLQRFACHVFRGSDSTRPVAEAVGRAFQRFYKKFVETAYPVEDIYIE